MLLLPEKSRKKKKKTSQQPLNGDINNDAATASSSASATPEVSDNTGLEETSSDNTEQTTHNGNGIGGWKKLNSHLLLT